MTRQAATVQLFEVTPPLPRGPHGLTKEEVAASQRMRLFAAMADLVAAKGFANTGVAEISREAHVSPNTFYKHFVSKLDCYLAAYDELGKRLLAAMGEAVGGHEGWQEFIEHSVGAYLRTLEDNPAAARAFLLEMDGAGPEARERRRRTYAQFAEVIKARHAMILETDPELAPLPDRIYLALVLGIRELARDALEREERPQLTLLAPDIRMWIAATVEGARRRA